LIKKEREEGEKFEQGDQTGEEESEEV